MDPSLPQSQDRSTKEPVDESLIMKIAADCQKNDVLIGRTNRSFKKYNNTTALTPTLIASREDIDKIVSALDSALGHA